jgi:hypothetical protein
MFAGKFERSKLILPQRADRVDSGGRASLVSGGNGSLDRSSRRFLVGSDPDRYESSRPNHGCKHRLWES